MGLTVTQIYNRANELIKYTEYTIFPQTDRENIISNAVVKEYSRRRPLQQLAVMTGASDNWYDLPSDFEDGFSVIQEIEYPVESSPKDIIAPKHYEINLMGDGKKLRFDYNNPALNQTFWMKYTIRHSFNSNGESEIIQADENGVVYLTVALWCKALADKFAEKADPNLSEIELVPYTGRVDEWNNNYEKWMKMYNEWMVDSITGVHGQIDFSQDMYFDRNDE